MKKFILILAIIVYFLSCNSSNNNISYDKESTVKKKSEMKQIYILKDTPNIRLIINFDSTFEYINLDPWSFKYNGDLHYITRGKWIGDSKSFTLNSYKDSIKTKIAFIDTLCDKDSSYTTFSFYNILNDSIGAYFVTYPNGSHQNYGTDMGAAIFHWTEDVKKNKSFEFTFSGYPNWKFYSQDGRNHKFVIHLQPILKPKYFKNAKFEISSDTLFFIKGKIQSKFIKVAPPLAQE